MALFQGPLARRLILSFLALAVGAVVLSLIAALATQFTSHLLVSEQRQVDLAVISARIRSESLTLTDLVRSYTFQVPEAANRPIGRHALRQKIGAQQALLAELLHQATDLADPNNVDQNMWLGSIEQELTSFRTQSTLVLDSYDLEQTYGPQTSKALAELVWHYQQPLVDSLSQFERSQMQMAENERAQLNQVLRLITNGLILCAIGVVLLVILMIRQVLVRFVSPLASLRTGVEHIRQGRLNHPVHIPAQDEMGSLAEALNDMASELELSHHQLAEYARTLEQQVAERTREAEQRAEQAAQLYEETQRLAAIDGLTDLYNRRHLMALAGREFLQAQRYQRPFSLAIFDIDHFKEVNDTYGHLAGDRALVALAHFCRENVRSADVLGRYGGEEFIILMPETDQSQALETAERLRLGIATLPIQLPEHITLHLTVSMGVATLQAGMSLDDLIKCADQALYAAKAAGRNRVCGQIQIGG